MPGDPTAETIKVVSTFTTPITTAVFEGADAMNVVLKKIILSQEAAQTGVSSSNVGGWHSTRDLLGWAEPSVAVFRDRLIKVATACTNAALEPSARRQSFDFSMEGWANVSRDGNYNAVHDHPSSHWSAVYYVAVGQADENVSLNGALEFIDPRPAINTLQINGATQQKRVTISPRPGVLVMFPSWLKHMVHPFRSSGERISIASNIRVR
ncbi:MAG: 2OG-Fe(II) oxygenase family protein [Pseudomonadota bacterium]